MQLKVKWQAAYDWTLWGHSNPLQWTDGERAPENLLVTAPLFPKRNSNSS